MAEKAIIKKSGFNDVSIDLCFLNGLFLALLLLSRLTQIEGLSQPFRLFTPFIALLGIIIGAIALITKRIWLGLALNLWLVLMTILFAWAMRA